MSYPVCWSEIGHHHSTVVQGEAQTAGWRCFPSGRLGLTLDESVRPQDGPVIPISGRPPRQVPCHAKCVPASLSRRKATPGSICVRRGHTHITARSHQWFPGGPEIRPFVGHRAAAADGNASQLHPYHNMTSQFSSLCFPIA